MRVIGIDPGSRICGWGVVEEQTAPQKLVHVDCGGIITQTRRDLPERLKQIYDELSNIIARHQPQEAAVESLFFHKNAKSALVLGHARGVALLACVNAGLPIFEYAPAQTKQALVGHGRAEKRQVAIMVKNLLGLPEVAMEDASDALAAAICHLNSRRMKIAMQSLGAQR
ncbi:MAG: crossover junction endodeoxyribonuclease RuvC [Candidatus Lernaella stagnicola]|nr:crossover junction endodeoxyribonuclease RuvC [Candidatus Lernaella stagnicola]